MHSKGDKIETMVGNETNEIIEELFDSLLQEYQKSLEDCIFFLIAFIYYITNFLK